MHYAPKQISNLKRVQIEPYQFGGILYINHTWTYAYVHWSVGNIHHMIIYTCSLGNMHYTNACMKIPLGFFIGQILQSL